MLETLTIETSMRPIKAEVEPITVEATVARVLEADLRIEIELVGGATFLISV